MDDIWKNGHAATADSRKNEFIQMREKKAIPADIHVTFVETNR